MNLRYEILRAVSKNPGAPAAEICDVIDYDRQKTTWSVRDCAKAGLLHMRRDDVTGQPGYTLTEAGKDRLAAGPATKQGGNAKHSQPAVEQNTGSSASDTCTSPAEGAAVQAQPAPDHAAEVSAAAPVAADDIPPPQYDPRSVAFRASTDAEQDQQRAHLHLIGVLADIRAAVGDREGRLMQDELVDRVHAVAKAGAVANADLDRIREVIGQRIHIGDPGYLAAPVKCAELAANLIDSLLTTNQESQNLIAIASEKLAEVAHSDVDTSDMELDELAEAAAAQLAGKDTELLDQARLVVDLRTQLTNEKALVAKLEHLLQSARNEAEHLRKHATAPDTSTMETVPLDALIDAVRVFVPTGAHITLPANTRDISICAFGKKFDIQTSDAAAVLDHVRALETYLDTPF